MSFFWFRKKMAAEIDRSRLPRHIAIIMDGNGRWAKKRGLPRTAGHKVGSETFRNIATYCNDIGIEYLTVYALSLIHIYTVGRNKKQIAEYIRNQLKADQLAD